MAERPDTLDEMLANAGRSNSPQKGIMLDSTNIHDVKCRTNSGTLEPPLDLVFMIAGSAETSGAAPQATASPPLAPKYHGSSVAGGG